MGELGKQTIDWGRTRPIFEATTVLFGPRKGRQMGMAGAQGGLRRERRGEKGSGKGRGAWPQEERIIIRSQPVIVGGGKQSEYHTYRLSSQRPKGRSVQLTVSVRSQSGSVQSRGGKE